MSPEADTAKLDTTTPEGRSERARLAVEARWSREEYWTEAPLDEVVAGLALLRRQVERVGELVQQRLSIQASIVPCYICDVPINIVDGKYAGSIDRHNPETMLIERAHACSIGCFRLTQQYFRTFGLKLPDEYKDRKSVV